MATLVFVVVGPDGDVLFRTPFFDKALSCRRRRPGARIEREWVKDRAWGAA